eukprot:1085370-Alexandrium_andersonii.AAC.1
MQTRATPQEHLRSLPVVPKFGPGFPGFTPPMSGSVAAATRPPAAGVAVEVPPVPKARLLSYKSVLELSLIHI